MAKNKKETNDNKNIITIDEKEYNIDDFNEEQVVLLNHVADLDRKIGQMAFNLDQLHAGKETFASRLKTSLES
jgi:hypothetical protein